MAEIPINPFEDVDQNTIIETNVLAPEEFASSISGSLRAIVTRVSVASGKRPEELNFGCMPAIEDIKEAFANLMPGFRANTGSKLEITSLFSTRGNVDSYDVSFRNGGNWMGFYYWYQKENPVSSWGMMKSYFKASKNKLEDFKKDHKLTVEETINFDRFNNIVVANLSLLTS